MKKKASARRMDVLFCLALLHPVSEKIEDYQKNDQHCQNDQQYGSQIVHKYTSSAAYCLAALHRHSLEG